MDVRAAVEREVGALRAFTVSPSRYATSARIDSVEAATDAGAVHRFVVKHLGRAAQLPEAVGTKPASLYDPGREVAAYTELLPALLPGPPRAVAHAWDGTSGWLVLEDVGGVELWQVGERDRWAAVAEWLARFHDLARARRADLPHRLPLVEHLPRLGWEWLARARRSGAVGPATGAELAAAYEVAAPLLADPRERTVVHGEFYASNVIVTADRVAPIDWEMVGTGPRLLDLAALVEGWPDPARDEIVAAYRAAAEGPAAPQEFAARLDACRLHLAVQWLGWAPGWSPPREHRQDWQAVALAAARRLRP